MLVGYMKALVYEKESQTQMYCYGTPLILLLSYRTFTKVCQRQPIMLQNELAYS